MKKNLQHIDEIRFLVIHLILVNHAMLSYALIRDKVDQSLVGFWFEFTSPILALISGYLFFHGSSRHLGFQQKLSHRFKSLVIPYMIWSLGFFIIYFLIKESAIHFFHMNFWYEAVKPLTVQNAWEALVHPPLVNFWYLQNLILIIPFNILFWYLLKNKIVSLIFFLAVLIVFSYSPVSIYFSARFLPFYLMGCFFGFHNMQFPKYRLPVRFALGHSNRLFSFFWIPLILFISVETGFIEYSGFLLVILKLTIALLLLFFIYYLLDASPDSRLFLYLKKYKPYSFFLFAIHTFIFTIVQRPFLNFFQNDFGNKYFTLCFSLLSIIPVLFISLALAVQIKKRWPAFFGLITGRG